MLLLSTTVFQSTLPLRGATRVEHGFEFYDAISIHAPLAGSDAVAVTGSRVWAIFQSTLPLRGATGRHRHHGGVHSISIHAPLAGSDPADRQGQ